MIETKALKKSLLYISPSQSGKDKALILLLLSRTPFAMTINPSVEPPKIAKNIHNAEAPQA